MSGIDASTISIFDILNVLKDKKIDKIKIKQISDITEITKYQPLYKEIHESVDSEVNTIRYFIVDRIVNKTEYRHEIKEVPYSTKNNSICIGDYITEHTFIVLEYYEYHVSSENIDKCAITVYIFKNRAFDDKKRILSELKARFNWSLIVDLLKIYARIK